MYFVCGIVYVVEFGYMLFWVGVFKYVIIKKMVGEEIVNFDKFIFVFFKFVKGVCVLLEFVSYIDRYRSKLVLVIIDCYEWYVFFWIYIWNDVIGLWDIWFVVFSGEVLLIVLKVEFMEVEGVVNGGLKLDDSIIVVNDEF